MLWPTRTMRSNDGSVLVRIELPACVLQTPPEQAGRIRNRVARPITEGPELVRVVKLPSRPQSHDHPLPRPRRRPQPVDEDDRHLAPCIRSPHREPRWCAESDASTAGDAARAGWPQGVSVQPRRNSAGPCGGASTITWNQTTKRARCFLMEASPRRDRRSPIRKSRPSGRELRRANQIAFRHAIRENTLSSNRPDGAQVRIA